MAKITRTLPLLKSTLSSNIFYKQSLYHKCYQLSMTLGSNTNCQPVKVFHTSSTDLSFWEEHRKGGYDTTSKVKVSFLEHLRDGFKELKKEIGVWKNEVVEKIQADPLLSFRPGETDIVWLFDEPKKLETWVTTADSDHNEGYSKCTLEMSKTGRALFSGTLDTRLPKDGVLTRTGYCAIRSVRHMKSFKRDSYFDWSMYNTLVLKVRGDGRSYLLSLSTEGSYDITWNDIYHYALYTRGGPYWQIAKIPFSKFFLASKGIVQDKQARVPLDFISHFGISLGDKIDGPFNLEIEYIGLELDPSHTEDFAYEMYQTDRYMVGC